MGGKPVVDEGLGVGAASQRIERYVDSRKRFEEIALLLEVSGKVCQFADLVLQFGDLLALVALKVLNNGGHLAFHRIFNLDRDVEALCVEVEVFVDPVVSRDGSAASPYCVWDDDGFGM